MDGIWMDLKPRQGGRTAEAIWQSPFWSFQVRRARGINLQEGADLAVEPLVVRPRQHCERTAIPGRSNFRNRGSSGDGSLLDRHMFYGVDT